MALQQANDILFAFKALAIVAGLSANARRVGGALIDHFNRKTGQCDPSIDRLSEKLGIDRATVFRATAELCAKDDDDGENGGLFVRVSHGGRGNRASYSPRWDRFRAIVNEWDGRKSAVTESVTDDVTSHETAPEKVAELRPRTSQNCDSKGRKTATQTNINNQSNKPLSTAGACGNAERDSVTRDGNPISDITKPTARQGLWKGNKAGALKPISVSHAQAARQQAQRRLDADLRTLGLHAYADAVERIDESVSAEATDAEVMRRGAGLAVIVQRLSLGGRGPPETGGGSKV